MITQYLVSTHDLYGLERDRGPGTSEAVESFLAWIGSLITLAPLNVARFWNRSASRDRKAIKPLAMFVCNGFSPVRMKTEIDSFIANELNPERFSWVHVLQLFAYSEHDDRAGFRLIYSPSDWIVSRFAGANGIVID